MDEFNLENKDSKAYDKTYSSIINEWLDFNSIHKEEQLKDRWSTKQQALRDEKITELLNLYVAAYGTKTKSNSKYRFWIMMGCAVVAIAAIGGCWYVLKNIVPMENKELSDVTTLITTFVGALGGLAGIIQIITKYVFPANEEQYITEIVKAIQANDLENKKVNISVIKPE